MATLKDTEWDYIIIGGGSAGCAVTYRLSADASKRTLLLEAGESDSHLYSRIPAAIPLAVARPTMNWQYLAEPDPSRANRVDMWPAGKMLGGGSSINGMMFVRGHRLDYDHWAKLGNRGWAYANVLPYFKRMENNQRGADKWRGNRGPLWVSDDKVSHPLTDAFVAGMTELGIPRSADLNGVDQEGVDYAQVTQKDGWRHSAAQAYLKPIRQRDNLHIETGAFVHKIEISGKRATGVSFRKGGEDHHAQASRGIVLCAGAMASPKLLMLSGIGDPQRLRDAGVEPAHALPGVGRNLQEHPGVIVCPHVTVPTLTSDMGPLRSLLHGFNFLFKGRGPLTNPVGHAHCLIHTRSGLRAPNVQIIFSPLAFDHHETGATPYKRPAVNLAVGLCRVRSRGEVRLRSNDPEDAPLINYALLSNKDDIAQLVEGVQKARELYKTDAFREFFVDERKPGPQFRNDSLLEHYVRLNSFLMYHACGTCRMGNGKDAVVDERLRVRGIDGLWVADASIIPTIPAGNINATVIMIGEKASDLILQG